MAIEIDNKKMLELILQNHPSEQDWINICDIKLALKDQGLCYKNGEITTIEPKVEWYMCIKESAGFKAGHIYKCNGGRFVNDLGVMFTAGYWGDYFRPATEEEVMKYSYKDKPNYPLMPSECTTIEPEVKWYVALNDYGHYDNIIFDAVPLFLKGERTTKENVFNMCKDIMGYEITEEEFNKNFRPATEEEILGTFDSKEGAWFAYKEGVQVSYNQAFNSLRNQAAIAAMQGVMNFFGSIDYNKEDIARLAVEQADELIKKLKEK